MSTNFNPAAIDIQVMDTRIKGIPGDVGNPATFPFPVHLRTVARATLNRLIHERDRSLLTPFILYNFFRPGYASFGFSSSGKGCDLRMPVQSPFFWTASTFVLSDRLSPPLSAQKQTCRSVIRFQELGGPRGAGLFPMPVYRGPGSPVVSFSWIVSHRYQARLFS